MGTCDRCCWLGELDVYEAGLLLVDSGLDGGDATGERRVKGVCSGEKSRIAEIGVWVADPVDDIEPVRFRRLLP